MINSFQKDVKDIQETICENKLGVGVIAEYGAERLFTNEQSLD